MNSLKREKRRHPVTFGGEFLIDYRLFILLLAYSQNHLSLRCNDCRESGSCGFDFLEDKKVELYICVLYRLCDHHSCTYLNVCANSVFRNEAEVGRAIRESGLRREEFFVVTKVAFTSLGYENTVKACKESLAKWARFSSLLKVKCVCDCLKRKMLGVLFIPWGNYACPYRRKQIKD